MKNLIYVYIVLLAHLIYLSDSGYALECYTCGTYKGENSPCEVDVTNKTVFHEECPGVSTVCVTLVIDVKSNSSITRSCGPSITCVSAKKVPGLKYCSTCSTDLCNNDIGISPNARFSPSSGYSPNYFTSLGIFAAIYFTVKLCAY